MLFNLYASHEYKKNIVWFIILIIFVYFRFSTNIGHEAIICAFLAVVLLACYVLNQKSRNKFRNNRRKCTLYILYLISFTIFTYISSFWALQPDYTVSRGNTQLIISVMMCLILINSLGDNNIQSLMHIAMFGGYIICCIAIVAYGVGNVINAAVSSVRLSNDLINSNDLGMCAAYSILINIYSVIDKKKVEWYSLLIIPASIILLGSESRKAIVIVGFGIVLMFGLNGLKGKGILKYFKTICILSFTVILIYCVLQLPIFDAINKRMLGMMNAFLSSNKADESSLTRLRLVEIGQDIFIKNPVKGIGINNAQFIAGRIFHHENYYLHNNYIELLADGGIIGFSLYYSIYAWLLYKYWRCRDFSDLEYNVCAVLLIVRLMMDYGSVSFLDRSAYFYLMFLYLKIVNMKKNSVKHRVRLSA